MKALVARSHAQASEQCNCKGPMVRYEQCNRKGLIVRYEPGTAPADRRRRQLGIQSEPVGCLPDRNASSAASDTSQGQQHSLHHMSSAGNAAVAAVSTPIWIQAISPRRFQAI